MRTVKILGVVLIILTFIFQVGGIQVNATENDPGLRITSVEGVLNGGVYYYPKVEGIHNPSFEKIQKAFNEQVKNDILSLKNDKTSSLNGAFTVSYFNGNIIAFRFVGDSFTPGTAHPNKLNVVFHYDVTTGKLYELADLFRNNIDYTQAIKLIAKKNDKAYRAKANGLFKDWTYSDFDTAWSDFERYFAIKPNILNVYFFSSYATGFASGYDIPFSSLNGMLNMQGSFYKALSGGKSINVDNLNYSKPVVLMNPGK